MRALWINLKSSLWFLPSLCVIFAIGLAVALAAFDASGAPRLAHLSPQFFVIGSEGARSLLSSIAQSVITIVGVSFSITVVALSIAANQYSPRVLRNFMRDRGNQMVLGGLAGIFTYCILVLRTIRGGVDSVVPTYSVVLALIFALLAVGLFIYFVHHTATAIQASTIISSVALETRQSIEALFPKEAAAEAEESEDANLVEITVQSNADWQPLRARASGYLQSMETASLIDVAEQYDTVLKMECAIGDFVFQDTPILWIARGKAFAPEALRHLADSFNIQSYRTIDQDPDFGLRQIMDIAVKALSPGINDPTTAITCLNYLGSILSLIVERRMSPRCMMARGKLRLIIQRSDFESLLDLAFSEIRHHGSNQPAILCGMLRVLEKLAGSFKLTSERRLLVSKHVDLILSSAEQNVAFPPELVTVRTESRKVLHALSERPV